jgi:hypothetical protein
VREVRSDNMREVRSDIVREVCTNCAWST